MSASRRNKKQGGGGNDAHTDARNNITYTQDNRASSNDTASSPNGNNTPSRDTRSRSKSPYNRMTAVERARRLTDEEKKQNHIASEHKRRQAIRDGFDRLTELVPGLEGLARSEGIVLQRTAYHLREQLRVRRQLIKDIESAGGTVPEHYKKILEDLPQEQLDKMDEEEEAAQANGTRA